MKSIKKEEAICLVKKTPAVYRFLPEALQRDRDVAIAFIKSNEEYISAYNNAILEEKRRASRTHEYRASSILRTENSELFLNGIPRDYPEVLGSFTDDVEVLTLLGGTRMCETVRFTDKNYNEGLVSKAIGKGFNLADPLFEYWYDRLSRDKKADEHVREKYRLTTDDSLFVVTAFKCLEVIDACADSHDDAYAALFLKCNSFLVEGNLGEEDIREGFLSFFLDYRKKSAPILRVFPVKRQNELAYEYHFLAGLIRPRDLEPALAELIAKNCPIARQLLPDEYILRYDLKYDPDCGDCSGCAKCFLRHILIL